MENIIDYFKVLVVLWMISFAAIYFLWKQVMLHYLVIKIGVKRTIKIPSLALSFYFARITDTVSLSKKWKKNIFTLEDSANSLIKTVISSSM